MKLEKYNTRMTPLGAILSNFADIERFEQSARSLIDQDVAALSKEDQEAFHRLKHASADKLKPEELKVRKYLHGRIELVDLGLTSENAFSFFENSKAL